VEEHVISIGYGSSSSPVCADVGGVSSSALTPPKLAIPDSSPPASQQGTHSSSTTATIAAPVAPADLVTPPRRSGRFGVAADGASTTDEDSLLRAMRRKAEINLDYSGMITPSKAKSFLSFSMLDISTKLSNVGIKLGINEKDILVSSNVLRRMEVDRLTVTPKVSTLSHTTYVDEEEAIAQIDG
jgi:hypothetical protein